MTSSIDHDDPAFGYEALTSPLSVEKYTASLSDANGSHGSFANNNLALGFHSFDTIEPATLQLPHTSHDDSCMDACPGVYNSQGLPRGEYSTAAPYGRPRFAASSCSFPNASLDSPGFPSAAQQYDQMYSFLLPNSDIKYPINLGGRNMHLTSNGQHFAFPISGTNVCTIPECPIPDDCASNQCSQPCSTECCSTQLCEDEGCADSGIPCTSPDCYEEPPSSALPYWDSSTDWHFPGHPAFDLPPHSQICNHTNTEHDVAKTLRALKEPGAPSHAQGNAFNAFECSALDNFDHFDHTANHCDMITPATRTPDLTSDTNIDTPVSFRPDVSISGPEEHLVCQWIMGGEKGSGRHLCGRVFKDSEELHEHLGKDHVGHMSSKTKYLCLWQGCSRRDDQVFASRNKLRRHISTHTSFKPFKCPTCGDGFSAQQALDQHIRIHTGETPYSCDHPGCGKSFKQKSALTMHKRTHTGEKPLECDICGKRFCESSNLSKHRKIHTADYKYKCDKCDKHFIRVDQLRRHALKHARDKEKGKVRASRSESIDIGSDGMSSSLR